MRTRSTSRPDGPRSPHPSGTWSAGSRTSIERKSPAPETRRHDTELERGAGSFRSFPSAVDRDPCDLLELSRPDADEVDPRANRAARHRPLALVRARRERRVVDVSHPATHEIHHV